MLSAVVLVVFGSARTAAAAGTARPWPAPAWLAARRSACPAGIWSSLEREDVKCCSNFPGATLLASWGPASLTLLLLAAVDM